MSAGGPVAASRAAATGRDRGPAARGSAVTGPGGHGGRSRRQGGAWAVGRRERSRTQIIPGVLVRGTHSRSGRLGRWLPARGLRSEHARPRRSTSRGPSGPDARGSGPAAAAPSARPGRGASGGAAASGPGAAAGRSGGLPTSATIGASARGGGGPALAVCGPGPGRGGAGVGATSPSTARASAGSVASDPRLPDEHGFGSPGGRRLHRRGRRTEDDAWRSQHPGAGCTTCNPLQVGRSRHGLGSRTLAGQIGIGGCAGPAASTGSPSRTSGSAGPGGRRPGRGTRRGRAARAGRTIGHRSAR